VSIQRIEFSNHELQQLAKHSDFCCAAVSPEEFHDSNLVLNLGCTPRHVS